MMAKRIERVGANGIIVVAAWIDADGFLYLQGDGLFERVKVDGSSEPEISYQGHADEVRDAVVTGGNIYWLEGFSNSPYALKTCPSSGCVGDPEVLSRDFGVLSQLATDDEYLYLLESVLVRNDYPRSVTVIPEGDRITRIALSGDGEPRVIAENVGIVTNMVIDDRFVYFHGSKVVEEVAAGIQRARYDQFIGAVAK